LRSKSGIMAPRRGPEGGGKATLHTAVLRYVVNLPGDLCFKYSMGDG